MLVFTEMWSESDVAILNQINKKFLDLSKFLKRKNIVTMI